MTDLSSQPTPIQTIYNWYRNGTLLVNRRYQRKLVWTTAEKQKLIDSILLQYPVPLILLAEPQGSDPAVYEIIDGLQRLHAILSFIENSYPTLDGLFFDVNEFTSAKDQKEKGAFVGDDDGPKLTREQVSKILNYTLPVSIIRNASSSVVTDVFSRINSYGHLLSEQERRQAGQLTEIARFVREIACELRGDVSVETLPLFKMPEISVDLQRNQAGYSVKSADVFWVRQGILRSTDLRDSMDEQLVADLSLCITGGIVERSKEVLDNAFNLESDFGKSSEASLIAYGTRRLEQEIKYCIEVIDKIIEAGEAQSLSRLIFKNATNNSFATVFSAIFIAIHEISFGDSLALADPTKAHNALNNVQENMNTTRNALSPDQRRANVNLLKGLLRDSFVKADVSKIAFGGTRELDIENTVRRSSIETPYFEMKQGILRLDDQRGVDANVIQKVLETICAIANIGSGHSGAVFVGVADKKADADRVAKLDGVEATELAGRWIVGVEREAKSLGISIERYYQMWRDGISNSNLSEPLKSAVLAKLDLCNYKDKQIIIASIDAQEEPSFLNEKLYVRVGDQTMEAPANQVLAVAARFKKS
ncbi:DUF262 domain-containing protein [Sphingobium sp. LMA1-1-1.1]|uniref:DUF262 domain-containing protein n=1 Tax=Sphingobium sp. LMA1-1-1.1 TaxID=3135238 RepID=UPI0034277337